MGACMNALSWAAGMVVNSNSFAERAKGCTTNGIPHKPTQSSYQKYEFTRREQMLESESARGLSDTWDCGDMMFSTQPVHFRSPHHVPVFVLTHLGGEGAPNHQVLVGTRLDDGHKPNGDCVNMSGCRDQEVRAP